MKKRISLLPLMVMMALGMMAQSVTIKGVVMAQDEPDPVIGANVMVKGTAVGTITDFDGNFELQDSIEVYLENAEKLSNLSVIMIPEKDFINN